MEILSETQAFRDNSPRRKEWLPDHVQRNAYLQNIFRCD